MSKLSEIIASLAQNARMGKAVKWPLPKGAEIGFLAKDSRFRFFVRRPRDAGADGSPIPDAFKREVVVFGKHAHDGGLKLKEPVYGRTPRHLYALFDVTRWPGQGAQQATLEEARP